jgi:hypothetical protein
MLLLLVLLPRAGFVATCACCAAPNCNPHPPSPPPPPPTPPTPSVFSYAFGCTLWELYTDNNRKAMSGREAAPQYIHLRSSSTTTTKSERSSSTAVVWEDIAAQWQVRRAWC